MIEKESPQPGILQELEALRDGLVNFGGRNSTEAADLSEDASQFAREAAVETRQTIQERSVETFAEQFSNVLEAVRNGDRKKLIKFVHLLESVQDKTASAPIQDLYGWIPPWASEEIRKIIKKYR